MAQSFEQAPDLQQIGKMVLSKYSEFDRLRESDCRIGFQWSDSNKKHGDNDVYADTTKVAMKTKLFSECDFVITFYKISRDLEDWQKERLMFHELLHVGYIDAYSCCTRNHDVEDFRLCIEKWGIDWLRDKGDAEQ